MGTANSGRVHGACHGGILPFPSVCALPSDRAKRKWGRWGVRRRLICTVPSTYGGIVHSRYLCTTYYQGAEWQPHYTSCTPSLQFGFPTSSTPFPAPRGLRTTQDCRVRPSARHNCCFQQQVSTTWVWKGLKSSCPPPWRRDAFESSRAPLILDHDHSRLGRLVHGWEPIACSARPASCRLTRRAQWGSRAPSGKLALIHHHHHHHRLLLHHHHRRCRSHRRYRRLTTCPDISLSARSLLPPQVPVQDRLGPSAEEIVSSRRASVAILCLVENLWQAELASSAIVSLVHSVPCLARKSGQPPAAFGGLDRLVAHRAVYLDRYLGDQTGRMRCQACSPNRRAARRLVQTQSSILSRSGLGLAVFCLVRALVPSTLVRSSYPIYSGRFSVFLDLLGTHFFRILEHTAHFERNLGVARPPSRLTTSLTCLEVSAQATRFPFWSSPSNSRENHFVPAVITICRRATCHCGTTVTRPFVHAGLSTVSALLLPLFIHLDSNPSDGG